MMAFGTSGRAPRCSLEASPGRILIGRQRAYTAEIEAGLKCWAKLRPKSVLPKRATLTHVAFVATVAAFAAAAAVQEPANAQNQPQKGGPPTRLFLEPALPFPFWLMPEPKLLPPTHVYPRHNAGIPLQRDVPQGPYAVEGIGLGDNLLNSHIYGSLRCSPSELFRDAFWCQRSAIPSFFRGPKCNWRLAF